MWLGSTEFLSISYQSVLVSTEDQLIMEVFVSEMLCNWESTQTVACVVEISRPVGNQWSTTMKVWYGLYS